jgi:hypothetical protein
MKKTIGESFTNSNIETVVKKIEKKGFKLIDNTFIGHNILNVQLLHNGKEYFNSGKGPVVKIKFQNLGCTQMFLDGKESDEFVIEFTHISERNQLISALELIVNELKK